MRMFQQQASWKTVPVIGLLLSSVGCASSFAPVAFSPQFRPALTDGSRHAFILSGRQRPASREERPLPLPSGALSSSPDDQNSASSSLLSDGASAISTRRGESMPDHDDDLEDMPWSQFQDWALRDNLPRYVVTIPMDGQKRLYALWRTMTREVLEIGGYNLDFLQKMHARQIAKGASDGDDKHAMHDTPGILPLLDDFEFESQGGIAGRVYGLPGIVDGTKIQTSALRNVETTVIMGYVLTDDGKVAYELGIPVGQSYSLDGVSDASMKARRAMLEAMGRTASMITQGSAPQISAITSSVNDPNGMLLQLGSLTAITLAGATAVSMLSHHLTLNVFWV
eukprot:CAMPEP_0198282928 /NCGR_PEP_ID=MMETSP1449-20131203/2635_1 /TAXON_ID=420275 /ORGANISM="Attheya septentrionalis, Strain CCMP2084" /LENGTH=338 /DNA_ID=CAMNT_0043979347 /DNA_START=235 /DNA_END=1251 /DNA_ORIENTATION=-